MFTCVEPACHIFLYLTELCVHFKQLDASVAPQGWNLYPANMEYRWSECSSFCKNLCRWTVSHWSKDHTQTEKGLKSGIYTHRICGESEVAVSAIILDALSFDILPSPVFFSKPSNTQYCNLQVVDFSKNIKVKCFSIPFFSLVKITANTMKSKDE